MSSEPRSHRSGRRIDAQRPVYDVEDIFLSMQEIVGRKWHPILLYHLLDEGPLGFSALKDRVGGISSKMLSESLTDLEEAGLVSRDLLSDQPVRVEYAVTDRGASLEPLIAEMVAWGYEHDVTGDGAATEVAAVGAGEGR